MAQSTSTILSREDVRQPAWPLRRSTERSGMRHPPKRQRKGRHRGSATPMRARCNLLIPCRSGMSPFIHWAQRSSLRARRGDDLPAHVGQPNLTRIREIRTDMLAYLPYREHHAPARRPWLSGSGIVLPKRVSRFTSFTWTTTAYPGRTVKIRHPSNTQRISTGSL
mgnify:CR=1 FL=1